MTSWTLAARYARRELRAGLTGFRIFVACLTLGVAAIAGVGTLSRSIEEGLRSDARALLGGDVSIRLIQRAAGPDERAFLADAGRLSENVEMRAMARGADTEKRTLIELKGVDDAYPLVGDVTLADGGTLSDALARRDGHFGAVVARPLLIKLGIAPGDTILIGDARFRVSGIITYEPDEIASVLDYGPRVMVAMPALGETNLIQPGSQVRHYYQVELPPGGDAAAFTAALEDRFPHAGWRVRTTDEAAPGLQRFVERMTLFLSFVGLTTLLVGGVGVTNAVASYLDARMETIATLKCLGAASRFIFRVYMIQILALTGIGLVLGSAFGVALPVLAAAALAGLLPVAPEIGVYWAPLAAAWAFGVLIAITFALWPLARARDVPAASLFRAKLQPVRGLPRLRDLATVGLFAAALAALTVATANDTWFALWFVAGAAASFALLAGAAALVKRLARRIHGIGGTELRLALANLHRPGATTTGVVLSLGLGLSVLVAIVLIEGNLTRQIEGRLKAGAPAFFFLDIQPDQVAAFDRTVTGVAGTEDYRRVASLRGRITAIDGVPVEEVNVASDSEWAVRGDRALTYAAEPPEGSKIVAGDWWPPDYSGPPKISLDSDLARGFGVKVGDTLTLNILGRDIEAEIASLREIDWRSLRFDFAIIFSPGILEAAPHSHIAAVRAPPSIETEIERKVAERFVNVSIVSVREALQAAGALLAGIGVAVQATAGVTIVAGALVLAGAVAAGRRRRIFDAVVFKVLGATRPVLLRAFVMEYGLLGLATGVIAAVVGALTSWAITVWLMELEWRFIPGAVAATIAACVGLALVAGFAGTWRALGQKAAPLLRNE